MPNRVRVRDFLRSQGIDDSRIGFDERTKTATLDGRDFFRGEIRTDDRMYGDPNQLQQLLRQFRTDNRVETPQVQVQSAPQPQQPQYSQQIQNILTNIQQRLNQPVPQFQYDPQRDPSYQSALERIRRNIQTQQADTGARLMATGQGRSSYSETLARQLANRGISELETDVIPSLASQAYQRFMGEQQLQQQNLSNLMNLAQFASGEDQRALENIFRERAFEAQQEQLDWENRFRYGQAIGQFPSGQQTLAAQQQQFQQQMAREQFEYQQARDAIADQRYQQEFDEDVRRFGLQFALDKAMRQGQLDVARMQAATSAGQLQLSRERLAQDIDQRQLDNLYRQWQMTGAAPEGIPGVTPGSRLPTSEREPTQNERTAEYISNLDQLSEPVRERFFRDEKANIVRDLGPSGYRFLVDMYVQDKSAADRLLEDILP